jgi:hypothetical protein
MNPFAPPTRTPPLTYPCILDSGNYSYAVIAGSGANCTVSFTVTQGPGCSNATAVTCTAAPKVVTLATGSCEGVTIPRWQLFTGGGNTTVTPALPTDMYFTPGEGEECASGLLLCVDLSQLATNGPHRGTERRLGAYAATIVNRKILGMLPMYCIRPQGA